LSALKHQKPEEIMIHGNSHEMVGENWERVLKEAKKLNTKMTIKYMEQPMTIFGKKIAYVEHVSDIVRNDVLREYGGIYIDTDVYICKSLDAFRKYEMTLNWDEGQNMGTQVLLANKNARFLKYWHESYKWYDGSKWYYNAGQLPTSSILIKFPHIIHRVKVMFGTDAPAVCPLIFRKYIPDWQDRFYTVHLTLRDHVFSWPDWCFGKNKPPVMSFDEENVKNLSVTFGEMARIVLYDRKDIINEDNKQNVNGNVQENVTKHN